jgi:hypothetical protein
MTFLLWWGGRRDMYAFMICTAVPSLLAAQSACSMIWGST